MRVQRGAVALEFDTVRYIQYGAWPSDWLSSTKPGDILLLAGKEWGQEVGMLRLTRNGTFVSVTNEQLYSGHLITWPDNRTPIAGIRLIGLSVRVVPKV
jgi:hypothetical protein